MTDQINNKTDNPLDLPLDELMRLYKAHKLSKIEEEIKQLRDRIEERKKEKESIEGDIPAIEGKKNVPENPEKKKRTKKWTKPVYGFLKEHPNHKFKRNEIAENIVENFNSLDKTIQDKYMGAISYALSNLASKPKTKIKTEEVLGEKGNNWYYDEQENADVII